ncbi:hypothetical protein [Thalassovita sp.]|nr:hypothetical protein [Thalassovita sp.]
MTDKHAKMDISTRTGRKTAPTRLNIISVTTEENTTREQSNGQG